MKPHTIIVIAALLLLNVINIQSAFSCRVDSEKFKIHVKSRIERSLDPEALSYLYWPDEPLDADILAKATGVNITMAETKFQLNGLIKRNTNEVNDVPLIEDLFISCSTDRNRQIIFTINLELVNPFKDVVVHYIPPDGNQTSIPTIFHIHLLQSTFLVQLSQQIGYEECLHVNLAQLAPNVDYFIECEDCTDAQEKYLDRQFKKRMTHLDSELTALLSDKLVYGLRILLNQERLELELYLDH